VGTLFEKVQEIFLNAMQNISPKNITDKSSKNEMISLSYDVNDRRPCLFKVEIHLTLYEFSQQRSYTDFDIKLDGLIRILA